ncbi:hypothetical protein HY025_05165 [Candidatus Daviesbacteria bacterium]|nr:hypothetical protein [Candidatus Daviesbacteria bacterium]
MPNFKHQILKRIKNYLHSQTGFSVLEIVLAAAVFVYFGSAAAVVVLQGLNTNRLGNEQTIATQYATEGIEIARSIKNKSFATLASAPVGNNGVVFSGGVWTFSGTSNTLASDSRFVRTIVVTAVQRDSGGNVVSSGGTDDANTKKVTSTVSWNFNSARADSVILSEYFTNWKSQKGGMIVYGDGGTTTDAVKYRIFDASANTWGTATAAFDVDGATTNKALRAIRMYSSKTRNEKIALTRHYNGTAQFIYATVWNGTSWGTPTQLSTWTATTFLDVLNFDGTYLNDGTFMVIYSDNTVIPKYRIWNGSTWAAQASLTTLGTSQIPNYIVAQARSATNEVMAAFFTQGSSATAANTITQYWSGSAWSAITTHSAVSITNTKRYVDFEWSLNTPTTGILIYADSTTDKTLVARVFVANGTGGGSWGTAVNDGTAQTNNLGAMNIEPRPGASEFHACNKDSAVTPTIVCRKITFSGNVPTFSAPTNPIIASATDTGIQRSFDIDWESISGDPMLAVYSDNTAAPKFKKYTASTSTWDSAATTISTTGFTPGVFKAIRIVPQDQGDDMIALMSDANLDVYSIFWQGSANAMYTTPASKTINQHGINGSATTEFWFDFTWDKF